jgi:hypothetical protein
MDLRLKTKQFKGLSINDVTALGGGGIMGFVTQAQALPSTKKCDNVGGESKINKNCVTSFCMTPSPKLVQSLILNECGNMT